MVQIATTVLIATMAVAPILAAPVAEPITHTHKASKAHNLARVTIQAAQQSGGNVQTMVDEPLEFEAPKAQTGTHARVPAQAARRPASSATRVETAVDEPLENEAPKANNHAHIPAQAARRPASSASRVQTAVDEPLEVEAPKANTHARVPAQAARHPAPKAKKVETTVDVPEINDPETVNHLQARGRFSGFKKAAKVGGKVASGAGVAATIGSMLLPQQQQQPQQRDLSFEEFLEARGKLAHFKKAAKVGGKVASAAGAAGTVGSLIEEEEEPEQREYLEARGKLAGFKKAAKIGGKVAGGVGTAATIGSFLLPQQQQQQPQQRRSFERREPLRFSPEEVSSGLKALGKVGGAAAGGVSLGAAVAPVFENHQRRRLSGSEISSGLKFAKKIGGTAAAGVSLGAAVAPVFAPHQQQRRSYGQDQELQARRISGAAIGKIGSAVAGAAGFGGIIAALDTKEQRRDLTDLDARAPFGIGSLVKGVEHVADLVIRNEAPQRFVARDIYELQDMIAREPRFGSVLKGMGSVASMVLRRDPELEIRTPGGLGGILKGIEDVAQIVIREDHGPIARDVNELFAERDFDELAARDPKFGSFLKGVEGVVSNFIREASLNDLD